MRVILTENSDKKKTGRLKYWLFILLVIVLIITIPPCLFFFLPTYVETIVIPNISRKLGGARLSGNIRRIGLTGADLGAMELGPKKNPALRIHSAQVDYNPIGLYNRKVGKIVLNGLEINLEYKDGKIIFPGPELEKAVKNISKAEEKTVNVKKDNNPVVIGAGEIHNAVVNLKWRDQVLRLPFTLNVKPRNGNWKQLQFILKVNPRGQKMTAQGAIDLEKSQAQVVLQSENLKLKVFPDWFSNIPDLILKNGEVKFNANLGFSFKSNLQVDSFDANCEIRKIDLAGKKFILRNSRISLPDSSVAVPVKITCTGNPEKWHLSLNRIAVCGPFPVTIMDFDIKAAKVLQKDGKNGAKNWDIKGATRLIIDKSGQNEFFPGKILKTTETDIKFNAQVAAGGNWTLRLFNEIKQDDKKTHEPGGIKFSIDDFRISSDTPEITVDGKGDGVKGRINGVVKIPEIKSESKNVSLKIQNLSLHSWAEIDFKGRQFMHSAGCNGYAENTLAQINTMEVQSSGLNFEGLLPADENNDRGINLTVDFKDAVFSEQKSGIKIRGISGSLPFKFPFKEPIENKGQVVMDEIMFKDKTWGGAKINSTQIKNGFDLNGSFSSRQLEGFKMEFYGLINFNKRIGTNVDLYYIVPEYKTKQDLDLGDIIPKADGIILNGTVMAEGNIEYGRSFLKIPLKTQLKNTSINFKNYNIGFSGSQLDLTFPNVVDVRSLPRQEITFKKAKVGSLPFTDGKIDFQIESPKNYLIEKTYMKWCGGNMYTQAMRIEPEKDKYDVTFFCDHLRLSDILEQLSNFTARGDGTVNGRIPVEINKGQITFKKGYLYSTPGQGGVIKLAGLDTLSKGLPPDSQQAVQIEFTGQALADFSYDWVRINIHTDKEFIKVHLKLFGKPAKPLSIAYDYSRQKYVRLYSKVKIREPMDINFNFSLPLNDVLDITKELKKMIVPKTGISKE